MLGFRFGRSRGMEGSTGNLHDFDIDAGNTTAIFYGDPVKLDGGNVVTFSAGTVDDDDILGIFQGCKYAEADGSIKFANHWDGVAGRSDIVCQVALPSGATFLVPGASGATYTQADIGTRKGFVYAAGDSATGQSKCTLGAPGATVATGPLVVRKRVEIPGDPNTPYFEVAIARPQLDMAVVS